MARTKTPKQHAAYLVVSSDNDGVPVGKVLLDKGNRLVAEWNWINYETGDETAAVGQRLSLLCAECRTVHRIVGILGHDGECGSDEVKEEGRQVLAEAKKRAAAEYDIEVSA